MMFCIGMSYHSEIEKLIELTIILLWVDTFEKWHQVTITSYIESCHIQHDA